MSMKAVGYVRVSTVEQELEGRSLEVQERAVRDYCARTGIELVRCFIEAKSAFRHDAREEFRAMCGYIEEHPEIEAVVCWKTIRAVRNLSDWALLTEKLRGGRGVAVISVTEGFPTTAAGQLMGGISAAFGRWQSQVLSEQTKANMLAWCERGIPPFMAPKGYRNRKRDNPKQRGLGVEPDPEEAPKVRELFERFASGSYTLEEIRELAYKLGLRSRTGKKLSVNFISKMLRNPFYIGQFWWDGKLYRGVYEPIVPLPIWKQVQRVLEERGHKRFKAKPENFEEFPLKGLLTCLYCGAPLTAQWVKRRQYVYYFCWYRGHPECRERRKWYEEQRLFERAATVLLPLQFTDQELMALERYARAWYRERAEEEARRREALERERREIERLLDAGLEEYLKGNLPEELWKRKSGEWLTRLKAIEAEIETAKGISNFTEEKVFRFLRTVSGLYRAYGEVGKSERSAILKAVLSDLRVGREKIEPVYKKWASVLAERPAIPRWRRSRIDLRTFLLHFPVEARTLLGEEVGGSFDPYL